MLVAKSYQPVDLAKIMESSGGYQIQDHDMLSEIETSSAIKVKFAFLSSCFSDIQMYICRH